VVRLVTKTSRRDRSFGGAPAGAGQQFLGAHGPALRRLRPISERDYVQRGLDYANWSGDDAAEFVQLQERLLVGGEWDSGTTILQAVEPTEDQRYRGQYYRDILIREISPLVMTPVRLRPRANDAADTRNPLDVPPSMKREVRANASTRAAAVEQFTRNMHGQVASIVVARNAGGCLELGHVYRPAQLHDAINLVLWMLLASRQPLAAELRQCEWEDCFNFYLSRRRRYCSDACMLAKHEFDHAERQRASRLGIAVKVYRDRNEASRTRKARSKQ
jgi:hypothetical protein